MNRISLALAMVLTVLISFSQSLTEIQTFRGNDTPNGSGSVDQFGREIEISGNTAAISAPGHNSGAGAVYVFELNTTSNEWVEVAKLTSSDQSAGKGFGNAIAMEGDVIVVANAGNDYANQGAYIFEKPVSGWTDMTETIKLNTPAPPTAANQSGFGASVDINGPEILVGAPREDVGGTLSAGRIYVFEKSGSSWTSVFLRAELTSTNVGGADYLGQSATFGDDIIVSGAFTGSSAGTLHVFERPVSGTWANATVEDIILFGSDRSNNDGFGGIVFSTEGVITTIGAADASSASETNVYIFKKETAMWSSQSTQNEQELIPLPSYMPFPGFSNAFSNTDIVLQGNIIVMGNGASTGPTMGNNSPVGSVLIYDMLSGNILHEIDGIAYSANGKLGVSVAFEGSKLLIGSQLETTGGVVRYFDLSYNQILNQPICPGESIALGAQTITEPGVYSEMFISESGLDSLVQLNVEGPIEPAVSTATTFYGTFNSTGLIMSPDADDQISTHYRITNIQSGTLYLNDENTQINNGDYISLSAGATGLKFRPDQAVNGSFDIEASVGSDGTCLSNSKTVSIVVNKAPLSVTANDRSITYGDAIPTLDGTLTGVVNSDNISATYATQADGSVAGSFDITVSLNDPNNKLSNYTVSNTSGTLTIAKAPLSVTANDVTITEEDPLPSSFALTYSGFVNSEDQTVIDTKPTASTTATAGSVGTYDIVLSGGSDDNYNLQLTDGTLTIEEVLSALEAEGIMIYPNPVSEMLTVDTKRKRLKSLQLLDLGGRVVMEQSSLSLDLSNLNDGTYILQIEDQDGQKTFHRILKR